MSPSHAHCDTLNKISRHHRRLEWNEFSMFCIEAGMIATRKPQVLPPSYQFRENAPHRQPHAANDGRSIVALKYIPELHRIASCESRSPVVKLFSVEGNLMGSVRADSVEAERAEMGNKLSLLGRDDRAGAFARANQCVDTQCRRFATRLIHACAGTQRCLENASRISVRLRGVMRQGVSATWTTTVAMGVKVCSSPEAWDTWPTRNGYASELRTCRWRFFSPPPLRT